MCYPILHQYWKKLFLYQEKFESILFWVEMSFPGQGTFDIKDFVWTLYKNKEDWDHSS